MYQAVERFLLGSTPASRCLLITGVAGPCFVFFLAIHAYGLAHDDIRAGLQLEVMFWLQAALTVAALALGALSLWLWPRRRLPDALPRVELALALLVGGVYTLIAIVSGEFTAGANLILMGILAIGLMLLQRRTMVVVFAACVATLLVCDVLVTRHWMPYGPAITARAFEGGRAVWWWEAWRSQVLYMGGAIVIVLIMGLFESLDSLHRHLLRLSVTDGLTGLANRRSFMARLQAELARQKRSGRPLSVVLIDADHFKRINDEHGHQMGDEVLKRLATVLSLGVRAPTDLAARLGGEEFGLVLPDSTREDAEAVCRRVQQALSTYRFGGAGQPLPLTVSMGVVQGDGVDAEALLRAADANLYQAKHAGRDRFVSTELKGGAS